MLCFLPMPCILHVFNSLLIYLQFNVKIHLFTCQSRTCLYPNSALLYLYTLLSVQTCNQEIKMKKNIYQFYISLMNKTHQIFVIKVIKTKLTTFFQSHSSMCFLFFNFLYAWVPYSIYTFHIYMHILWPLIYSIKTRILFFHHCQILTNECDVL